jgi:hypothetical protein
MLILGSFLIAILVLEPGRFYLIIIGYLANISNRTAVGRIKYFLQAV